MKFTNVGNRVMNTYVYEAPCGYVMIDTGYQGSFRSVVSRLQKKGISASAIKYIFLTHAHDDHAGFLNEFMNAFPDTKVIINPASTEVLRVGQNRFIGGCSTELAYAFCKMMTLWGKGKHIFPPLSEENIARMVKISETNKTELENLLGGTILFTPGHTNDSISLKIGKYCFCGDAAMNGFPSLHHITIWIENTVDFHRSWKRLLSEKIEVLLPSHGKPFKIKELRKCIEECKSIDLRSL